MLLLTAAEFPRLNERGSIEAWMTQALKQQTGRFHV